MVFEGHIAIRPAAGGRSPVAMRSGAVHPSGVAIGQCIGRADEQVDDGRIGGAVAGQHDMEVGLRATRARGRPRSSPADDVVAAVPRWWRESNGCDRCRAAADRVRGKPGDGNNALQRAQG